MHIILKVQDVHICAAYKYRAVTRYSCALGNFDKAAPPTVVPIPPKPYVASPPTPGSITKKKALFIMDHNLAFSVKRD